MLLLLFPSLYRLFILYESTCDSSPLHFSLFLSLFMRPGPYFDMNFGTPNLEYNIQVVPKENGQLNWDLQE